jgi:hypothetical protein
MAASRFTNVVLAGVFAVPTAVVREALEQHGIRVCSTGDYQIDYFLVADDKVVEKARQSKVGQSFILQHPDIRFMRIGVFLQCAFQHNKAEGRELMARLCVSSSTVDDSPPPPPRSNTPSIKWDEEDHVQEFDLNKIIAPRKRSTSRKSQEVASVTTTTTTTEHDAAAAAASFSSSSSIVGSGADDGEREHLRPKARVSKASTKLAVIIPTAAPPTIPRPLPLASPAHLDFVFFDATTQAAWLGLRPKLAAHRFLIDSHIGVAALSTSKTEFVSRSEVVLDLLASPNILVNLPDLLTLLDPAFPRDDQLIQVPVKLGIFATSLTHTTAAHNYAVEFFRQHFPRVLQTLLLTGVLQLTQALGCAFETVQRGFLAEVARDENLVHEDDVCALTIVVVDRNITGCVVVLNAGNATVLQRDVRRGTYDMVIRAQLPPTRLLPSSSSSSSTTPPPHVRIESSDDAYAAFYVQPSTSSAPVHSNGGFGSKYWVHNVFYADRKAQMRAAVHQLGASQNQGAFEDATREVGMNAQRWAACCAHTIEVFTPSTDLPSAPTSLIICNDSFFYGASAREGLILDTKTHKHLQEGDLAAASTSALKQLQAKPIPPPVFRVLPVCWQILVTRRTEL